MEDRVLAEVQILWLDWILSLDIARELFASTSSWHSNLSFKKIKIKYEQYSVSLISGWSQGRGFDLFRVLYQSDAAQSSERQSFDDKNILQYLYNAAIHSQLNFIETSRQMHVNVLFSAPYLLWLNSSELLFVYLKRKKNEETTNSR